VKRYYPTNALVTGFDIIFFWVARMMMMGLHFQKEVPFRDVYIHRLVRDASGAKMSKSKGNVVDPLGVIDDFGADALRFTLMRAVAPGHDIRLGPQDVENNRNFATKLWNAARFAEMNGCATVAGFNPKSAKETLNRWIAHETAKAAAEITGAIESYGFSEAAGAAYRFVWNVYCDWYLELAKPILLGPDGASKRETQAMVAWTRDEILKLLHPFMPFITEELWAVTGERTSLLALTEWPHLAALETMIGPSEPSLNPVIEVVSEARSIRTTYNIQPKELLTIDLTNFNSANTSILTSTAPSIARLANTNVKVEGSFVYSATQRAGSEDKFSATAPSAGTQISATSSSSFVIQTPVKDGMLTISLPGTFDLTAERARLAKEMQKADADIARCDAKLNNPKFMERAAEEVVEEEKEKREEAVGRKAKIAEALERLKGAT
jgi:valyl-tRNA synthetase